MLTGYRRPLIISLIMGGSVLLVLFWLRFVNVSQLHLVDLSQLYDIENQNTGYHNVQLTASFFTLLMGILNVDQFTHVRIERLIRQRSCRYYGEQLKQMAVVALIFCIWFYGIDAGLLVIFIPHQLLLTPLIILTLGMRVVLAIGYYVLVCEVIYFINSYVKQFAIALFATPVLMMFSLRLCSKLNWSHPLMTIDTFNAISVHGLDIIQVLQGAVQLMCLLLLLFALNVWRLGQRDFL